MIEFEVTYSYKCVIGLLRGKFRFTRAQMTFWENCEGYKRFDNKGRNKPKDRKKNIKSIKRGAPRARFEVIPERFAIAQNKRGKHFATKSSHDLWKMTSALQHFQASAIVFNATCSWRTRGDVWNHGYLKGKKIKLS
jgi:hypothetical protein